MLFSYFTANCKMLAIKTHDNPEGKWNENEETNSV